MRMRVGVLWSAAVLALLAVSAALRTPQVEGVTRTSRRIEAPSDPEVNSSTTKSSDSLLNYRTRYSRRQETPRDVTLTRARSRPETAERAQPERVSGNERFDSRRTRTRTRPEAQPEPTKETFKNTAIRSRSRARRPTSPTLEVSRPIDAKIEANINEEVISRTVSKQNNRGTSQFRRRSSTVPTETVNPKRGRIVTRPKVIAEDLDSSGSTNTILITDKAPTTARTSADLRDAKKLRYKTRPSEIESNLTGEGIINLNEVKSSQTENATSQSGTQTVAPIFVERIVQQSTETSKPSTTLKVTRVVRRPVARRKATHTPVVPKKKSIDDIDEDDNYPESFKALIQAKNATQANSSIRESLSVTASHKVVNTYSTLSSSQPTQTDPAENNHLMLRTKQNANESSKPSNPEELTTTPEIKSRYKQRGKYSVKNKKSTTFRPDITTASSIAQNIEKSGNKYKRKFKFSTTTQISRTENNNISNDSEAESGIKRPANRPSFHSRRFGKTSATSTEVSVTVSEKKEEHIVRKKISLPRTGYYSRLRNKTETTTTTAAPREQSQKKTEDLNDMPLIFTLLNNSENKELVSDSLKKEENEVNKEPFIISISSTESQENMVPNELRSNEAEVKNTSSTSPSVATKQEMDKLKYHANYKNSNQIVVEENTLPSSTVLPVRNLQRRRQKTRQKEKIDDSPKTTTARSRDRNVRKFTEAFSKTTEASNNGIIAGTDKAKSKFSSKYRASYLDKPFYKPTVPSITSSTVEGEEMQLGPDNAISITQTRRTLSSADLTLSESLLKSSQIMNVEASQHSPSVTVSIYDALADILTSTPKTRLSSTTEVTTEPNFNIDFTQILNGVSNIVNVNRAGGITSPDAFVPANASTTTQSVQNTDQTTPIVINNNMSAGESVTRSLNTEVITSVNILPTLIPTPTTPLSARKPFAIKFLYSDTESPTDKTSTASDHTSNQPTTDNPKMTKQIRTEKPEDGGGNTVFKFIPIDEVMVKQQNSNVLKLATKAPSLTNTESSEVQIETATRSTEVTTQASQTQANTENASTSTQETTIVTNTPLATTTESTTVSQTTEATPVTLTTTQAFTTTQVPTTMLAATTQAQTTTQAPTTTTLAPTTLVQTATTLAPTMTEATTTQQPTTVTKPTTTSQSTIHTANQNAQNSRDPKYLSVESFNNMLMGAGSSTTTKIIPTTQQNDPTALLQALLSATGNSKIGLSVPDPSGNNKNLNRVSTTTSRSLEEDIRQFEEDTKLLKALLAATGQNPANLNIPSLDILSTTELLTTQAQTTTTRPTTTTVMSTTTQSSTTPTIQDDLNQFQEDAKLLQALLQATGQNTGNINLPDISKVTSNIRIASNPLTTQIGSKPTTPRDTRPLQTTTNGPVFRTVASRTVSTPAEASTTEEVKISTTFTPFIQRSTTSRDVETGTISGRQAPSRFSVTTEMPSSSTFSVEEDLVFLNNLKQVLNTNTGDEDPETALANRIISLAVDRSLTEIQTGNANSGVRTGKTIANGANNLVLTTSKTTTTTTPKTTTTQATTTQATTQRAIIATSIPGGPSLDADIKQFQEDTKLLQALLKATGQDPSKFKIPTLPNITPTDAQETTTFRSKLVGTSQTSDQALKKLIQQQKATGMMSEATKSPISLSTEYGKSNDALLAALLKDQGFGPTTASSIDEQVRLAALLNQVVVTPKARRPVTPPPPPPPPRRPVLDGLAWLWQQWRETSPGPAPTRASQRPGPAPSVRPSEATSNRVNWFGSGPFTGNADDRPASSNRIPLEPPRAVASEQGPGRGQLVSAAINMTRAFSQFLGAAIQGAAQTVQSVIRAGQRAATDVYSNGSGGSG